MSDEFFIVDEDKYHKYYTRIPNMVDDLLVEGKPLSPYAVRLYLRLKRRAGEDGECWENTRHLAEGCRMSIGQVVTAKRELQTAGLIQVADKPALHGHFNGHTITIKNIWRENYQKYSPTKDKSPVHVVNRPPVHLVNTSCSPGDIKEEPLIKNRGATDAPPSPMSEKTSDMGFRGAAAAALRSNPAIQAYKEVFGHYPRKNLYPLVVETFGENPDKALLWRIKMFIDLRGYNPTAFMTIRDRYNDRLQYVTGQEKATIDSMVNPYEV